MSARLVDAYMDAVDAVAARDLLAIGQRIGFGNAQSILGRLWDEMLHEEYGAPPGRGAMGVTVDDAARAERAEAAQRVPLTEADLRAAFAKVYPQDDALLALAENNKDYRLEAIGARHHWTAFVAGARAIERHFGISAEQEPQP